MRFVVLLFGFVGILMTGALGVLLVSFDLLMEFSRDHTGGALDFFRDSLFEVPHNDTALVLFLAAAFGAFGTLLAFLRCGKQGGVLLLVPVLCAAAMNPYTLAFTWMQGFAGLLSFFVKPLPLNAPKEDDD
jgi:hypothetical protein